MRGSEVFCDLIHVCLALPFDPVDVVKNNYELLDCIRGLEACCLKVVFERELPTYRSGQIRKSRKLRREPLFLIVRVGASRSEAIMLVQSVDLIKFVFEHCPRFRVLEEEVREPFINPVLIEKTGRNLLFKVVFNNLAPFPDGLP